MIVCILYHEDFTLKKWTFTALTFIFSFILLVVLLFEFVFRLLTADFVISLMDKLSFLGLHASLETLVALLVLFSALVALIISGLIYSKFKR